MSKKKNIIYTPNVPKPIGPYSQAVEVDGYVFLSGQLPLDPKTGEVVSKDIKLQTRQVMENIKTILESAGTTIDNVIKTTIYITDISQFSQVNEVYKEYFVKDYPARSTVGVAALPKGVGIEMEVIATKNSD